jgi:hypothetical protein
VAVSVLCAGSVSLQAEEFLLVGGGRVVGQWLNPDQSPRSDYLIQVDGGPLLRLANDQVDSVVIKSPAELQYDELLPRMPNTVDGHWKMAEWCREQGLDGQREYHLTEVVKRQPDHEEARYALDYRRIDGRWVKPDEYMVSQGYIRDGGAWRMRQEVELERIERERELAQKQWGKQLRMWRSWIVKQRGRQQEAVDGLADLKDPLAAPALAEMLDEEEFNDLKLTFIAVLGRLQAPASFSSLIRLSLEDSSAAVREKSLEELARFAQPQAVQALIKGLSSKDNRIVNRAAMGLEIMNDSAATVPLIDALTTKHRFQIGRGGGIGTTFGQQGGGV